jgi:hypothetical protein
LSNLGEDGIVTEISISPAGKGVHVHAWLRKECVDRHGLEHLRLVFGDDPERVWRDRTRPTYAKQVLFHSKQLLRRDRTATSPV